MDDSATYHQLEPEMTSNVVELAAWIIVGKAVGQLILQNRNARRQRIEKAAVTAEYNDTIDAEYSVDETLSERDYQRQRARHRERQSRLLMRYPQHLIPSPDWHRYFKQAEGSG
jgi:hypothetical protein